ncbi:hypothetical protein Q7P36_004305 [Cladosporium allicinum]
MGIKGAYSRFRESRLNLWLQRILRFIQFVSPVISIGLFASRLVKIVQKDPTEGRGRLTASNGAVVGILAAAILYTLIAMLLSCFLEHKPKLIRWSLMFLDLCFVGAFIAVAVLTRPNGGSSGPCRKEDGTGLGPASQLVPRKGNCSLPWGTFITAIISTILHFITALFHEAKDKVDHHRQNVKSQREMSESTIER